ncbi:Uncharacterized protein dnm_016050 [Desulfonema magnum]|uniref:Uncharacterized protein n=1 Tax=Desulfonema magnum TaxID=45655 RepID=A0A975BH20_9BACT|nr:Uncharacterized protein dnm_016050 [Desulfonema magnum]
MIIKFFSVIPFSVNSVKQNDRRSVRNRPEKLAYQASETSEILKTSGVLCPKIYDRGFNCL